MPRIAVDKVEPDLLANPVPSVPVPAAKDSTQTDQEMKQVSGTSVLTAFKAFPDGIFFSGEEDNEEIIILLRAHIITNLPWILISLALALVLVIILPLLGSAGLPLGIGSGIFFTLLWYLGIFTYAFINFLYWYFNVYIVTNERIIDVDWYSVIYRKVSSAQISHIEDVTASQGGVFAGVFDYGNVGIQTAAEERNFEFTAVPHPQLVAKKIGELMQAEEKQWEVHP